jgi:UDP-2,3-diacylglucosamine hydrolase
VHGHTHRPAEHDLDIHGKPGKRIVLGDWHTRGWMLDITPQGYTLGDFPISEI